MPSHASNTNAPSSTAPRRSIETNKPVFDFHYNDWPTGQTSHADFTRSNVADLADLCFRRSIDPEAPESMPPCVTDAIPGWAGYWGKERVGGDGTDNSATANAHVTTLVATRVDNVWKDNVKIERYERPNVPTLRLIFGPTSEGASQLDQDLMSFEGPQVETTIDGGKPVFVGDNLISFESRPEEKDPTGYIAVEMQSNGYLAPTKATLWKEAQGWRPQFPGYPIGNPSMIIRGVLNSKFEAMCEGMDFQFTATSNTPTWHQPGFLPTDEAVRSIESRRALPESRTSTRAGM
jgi:hypothetical protein